MGLNSVYGRQVKDYTLSTAAFRFAVVSKVCGLDNIDDVQILDSKQFRGICGKPMTETLERLLLLYGAGIIDFTVIEDLVTIKEDISDVLRTAEEFLIDQMQKYEKLRTVTFKGIDLDTADDDEVRRFAESMADSMIWLQEETGYYHIMINSFSYGAAYKTKDELVDYIIERIEHERER